MGGRFISAGLMERRDLLGAIRNVMSTGVSPSLDMASVLPAASRLAFPVLIAAGEADWIVPTAGARKEFLTTPNASHDGAYSSAPDPYRNAVLGFMESSLRRR
jgi:pimeloyl-ACP methyl ester carboxylesterase